MATLVVQTSQVAVEVSTKDASVLSFSTIDFVQEDPDFLGTHSGTRAEDGVLMLGGAGMFDDIPDFDALSSLDDAGGVSSSGTYSFAAGIDLGTVTKCRLATSIEVSTINVLDRIDSRTANIDDWADFDGTAGGGSVDARIEVRETDDDPGGSPTWSAWNAIHIGDYEARAFQFQAVLTSTDPAFNIHVTKLRVTAKEIA